MTSVNAEGLAREGDIIQNGSPYMVMEYLEGSDLSAPDSGRTMELSSC
jgi:hypothetical protein